MKLVGSDDTPTDRKNIDKNFKKIFIALSDTRKKV